MKGLHKIFGSEMSPYSIKVRSYFRYKGLAHAWIPRTVETDEEYRRYARLPIVPTVARPDETALQDSTPIIEALEAENPEPSIHPKTTALAFVSALIEEFGDEWGNKLMFHHRWWDEVDARASARTLARLNLPHATAEAVESLAATIHRRMTGRGHFVGSSPQTAALISDYYVELLDILEPHLTARAYLLGGRPSFGDFGLSAQLYEASVDPTCGGIIRARGPHVLDWCLRMNEPRADGPFEAFESLEPTLGPLLGYIGRYFLPWTTANARALEDSKEAFSVELAGRTYTQPPQKYHAKSLAVLKRKYGEVAEDALLNAILAEADCLRWLAEGPGPAPPPVKNLGR